MSVPAPSLPVTPSAVQSSRHLLLAGFDPVDARLLEAELDAFGYRSLTQTDDTTTPCAVLLDLDRGEPPDLPDLPLFAVTNQDDLATRLKAVRLGADACFTRPLDTEALLDRLEPWDDAPCQVLVVDSERDRGRTRIEALEAAGMSALLLPEPLHINAALVGFNADLLLISEELPDLSGQELAAALRQQDNWVGLPALILTENDDPQRQLDLIHRHGDPILCEPLTPSQIVMAVRRRLWRSRLERRYCTRDGLSGLLNQQSLKDRLEIEVLRAARHRQTLGFARLDIDGLGIINEQYGPSAGDKVIRALGRLLHSRLRRTDITGRLHADKFAVILPQTERSLGVLEDIRIWFGQLNHPGIDRCLNVTLSAGVAEFPFWEDAEALNQAAHKALSEAKRRGGNRVAVA